MPIVLLRVDDRLIHGQVTMGWGHVLHPDRIVVVNDRVAESTWEKELCFAAVPLEMKASILSMTEGIQQLTHQDNGERLLVLVDSPGDAIRLIEGGVPVHEVNIGGMHFCEGKRQILPFVCVNPLDIEHLRTLDRMGINFDCRDVPTSRRIDLKALLSEIER
jgi:mannose/fructose/N-acetylgalactosamine-specific phosphotransferase system component IIB